MKKRTIVIEVNYSRRIVTERYGPYASPEEALNHVVSELGRGKGTFVVHEAKAYAHPTELPTLPEHCGANCLRFLTKERRARLKQMLRDREHNMAATEAWLIEHDNDWAIEVTK